MYCLFYLFCFFCVSDHVQHKHILLVSLVIYFGDHWLQGLTGAIETSLTLASEIFNLLKILLPAQLASLSFFFFNGLRNSMLPFSQREFWVWPEISFLYFRQEALFFKTSRLTLFPDVKLSIQRNQAPWIADGLLPVWWSIHLFIHSTLSFQRVQSSCNCSVWHCIPYLQSANVFFRALWWIKKTFWRIGWQPQGQIYESMITWDLV